MEVKNAQWQ